MSDTYHHSQTGVAIVVTVGITAVALIFGVYWGPLPRAVLVLAGALIIAIRVFGSLTVDIDSETLLVRFGFGLVRRRFVLSEIRSATPVRNRWYHGWGIHPLRRGWIYNVSGFDAVEIELGDGSAHRIGTDEPRTLAVAIRRASGLPANQHRHPMS
jgi:hypothetical protein